MTGESTVAGYTYEEMIAYYLLTQISRAFSSMPGLANGIALQIRGAAGSAGSREQGLRRKEDSREHRPLDHGWTAGRRLPHRWLEQAVVAGAAITSR